MLALERCYKYRCTGLWPGAWEALLKGTVGIKSHPLYIQKQNAEHHSWRPIMSSSSVLFFSYLLLPLLLSHAGSTSLSEVSTVAFSSHDLDTPSAERPGPVPQPGLNQGPKMSFSFSKVEIALPYIRAVRSESQTRALRRQVEGAGS